MRSQSTLDAPVVIVGAGPVGLVAATPTTTVETEA
jgi:thioredoxin reductase